MSGVSRCVLRAVLLGCVLGGSVIAAPVLGRAANIIDEWDVVKDPPVPQLHKVTLDPKTTVLMVMGFVQDSCNAKRRPRCAATIPHVAKLLNEARAHGVFIVHSVPPSNPTSDFLIPELRALPGEFVIPPNGPNKFLPYDFDQVRIPDFDLDKTFAEHNVKTVITVGTQAQTAVLHTAAEAALRGYKVIVPVDGMSGATAFPEKYTVWHLANTQRVMQQVTLTAIDLIGY